MAQYDGSIRINTKIDIKSAEVQLSTLENKMVKTADKVSVLQKKLGDLKADKSPTEEYARLSEQLSEVLNNTKKLEDKQQNLSNVISGMSAEQLKDQASALWGEFDKATKELEDIDEKFADIARRKEELLKKDPGGVFPDLDEEYNATLQYYTSLQNVNHEILGQINEINDAIRVSEEIEKAKLSADQLENKLTALEEAGKAFTFGKPEEIAKTEQELKYAKNDLATLGEQHELLELKLQKAQSGYKKLSQVAKSAFSKIGSAINKVVSSVKKFGSFVKNAFSGLTKSAQKSNGLLGTMGNRFKSLAMSLLIFNQISAAFRAMSKAIKEGFTNLYKEVSGFQESVNSLKASALTLKNSFAAAFRPLAELAIPYIQQVIEHMTRLMDTIGQFTAAITGQKQYTKAIRQTTAALEEEDKASNKQLSSLDKLNNLSSGGGADSGGGASGTMFEEAPIDSGILSIFQNLKDLIEGEDWEGLRAYVAESLNSGLQKIYDIINWDTLGVQVAYFASAFTDTFNSIVDNIDWDLLGRTIGAGINTIVNTLTLLVTGIDWVNLGKSLATGLNGIVNEVNFENLGNLIGQKFMVLPRILLGFVTNLDWAAIGDQIGNALNGVVGAIDLSQIGTLLGTILTGIFQMAINFADTFDWEALGTNIFQGINAFFTNTDWATVGQGISDFAMGLLDALLVAISGIDWGELGKSIIEFILAIDWLGLVVKLDEIGYQLIYGLCEGILGALSAIGTWIKENVFDPIVGWFKDLFGIHSPSTVFAELGTYLIEGLFIGISSLVDTIKEIWAGMKDTAVSIWTAVKDKISNIVSNIKSVITSALTLIKTIWSTSWTMVRTIATQVWTGIKQSISSIINSVKTVISTALALIKKTWDTAWTGMKNTVVNIFNAIWSAIKGVINSILGGIEGMANGVINGVNSVIKALNGLSFTIPATPFSDAMTIGLNIPSLSNISIPRLATGTVVPPNNEFMAVLGDNKREPEVVSPLSTIEQAVENAIRRNGGMGGEITIKIPVEIDGRILFELVKKFDLAQYKRTGRPSFQV